MTFKPESYENERYLEVNRVNRKEKIKLIENILKKIKKSCSVSKDVFVFINHYTW